MSLISVVIPTIPGREAVFTRVYAAYANDTYGPHSVEFIVERGHPTVGRAWQAGAEKAAGDYIHLTNDDCEPHPGWWHPAVEAVERGYVPAPQVYDRAGGPQSLPVWGSVASDWTPVHCGTIPFLGRSQWENIQPLFTAHYWTDQFITDRAQAAGWPCVLRTGYAFTHYWAQPGRGAGMSEADRMAHDKALYRQALAKVEVGGWKEPWP